MASLLVIGGSGFFGKSILDGFRRGLLNKWNVDEVIILSRSASKLITSNPELINNNVRLLDLDIATCKYLPFANLVIHAAASTDASKYLLNKSEESENILAGTRNFCDLAKLFLMNSKIIYISSGAVYGVQPERILEIKEEYCLENNINLLAINKIQYAIAKLECEKMIKSISEYGIKTSIARCFAFVGRYLPLDQHFAIGNFIRDGLKGEPIKVKSENIVYRTYMYADDLVEWMLSIIKLSSTECPIFNVGSNEIVRLDHLAKKIADKFNTSVDIKKQNTCIVDRYVPSIKMANKNGIFLKYTLDNSIDETIRFLIDEY